MGTSRRDFLFRSGLLAASSLAGCKPLGAPSFLNRSQRTVTQALPGYATVDGAGVRLTRIIGQPALRHLDPFVLLDRIHSEDPADYVRGFPKHPHRGFETVTVMLQGSMRHQDSRGNHGVITGGGAQWMTAGRGIVHSEMPEQEHGLLSGFQLWVNLPASEKMCPQYYQDLAPGKLAEARLSASGSALRIISGRASDLTGPVRYRPTQPTLATLRLEDDQPFELALPVDDTAFVFIHSGALDIGPETKPQTVPEGTLALLSRGRRLRIRAPEERSVALIASGRPLNEPIVQSGPFVMNTQAEIEQAFVDYRAGRLEGA